MTDLNEFDLNMKTSISTEKPVFDIHDNYLPYGNYFFTIKSFSSNGTSIGTIKINNEIMQFEFKNFTVIRMMAKSQARLHRRANIFHLDMPDNPSPSHTPSVINNYVLSSNSPRVRSNLSPAPRTSSNESSPPALSLINRKVSSSTESDEDSCTICFESNADFFLPCNHFFHLNCIKEWESRNVRNKPYRCPNCNQSYCLRFGRRYKTASASN